MREISKKPKWLDNLPFILFVSFAVLLAVGVTLGTKTDYDVWFHYQAGEYFFMNGNAPTIAIDSWYALSQGVYWVSHEWLFGAMIYKLMNISPYLVNLLPTFMLAMISGLVAFYNRKLFEEKPVLAVIGVYILVYCIKMGNTPRPHLFAYLFTFLLFAILRKDAKEEGNTIYWLIPLTIAWVNMHGGSYILLFVFLLINILSGCFDLKLGKIVFKMSSVKQQLKRIAVFAICLSTVGLNAHGLTMYSYPFINFADNIMQSAITEWAAPDLKVAWQIYIYITIALFATALISTEKEIKAVDFMTGFAYTYLTMRSIRFAPQLAIVVVMMVGEYSDSLFFFKQLSRKLLLVFCGAMVFTTSLAIIPSAVRLPQQGLFNVSMFPSDALIDSLLELEPERIFNPYDSGGYLTYKGVEVFVDGRADIYTPLNFRDFLTVAKGNSTYMEVIEKYDFDYMLVVLNSTIDTLLSKDPELFTPILSDKRFRVYKVEAKAN